MMDTPYRVEQRRRISHNGQTMVASWAIKRTGMDDLCWTDDVTWAYRLCDLLNRQEAERATG
jgi:hypothetical protein